MKAVHRHSVSILDESFVLMSDEDSGAIKFLVERVETLLQEISFKTGNDDMRRVAILALCKVMSQLQELESKLLKKDLEESQLVNYINQQLSSLAS